MTTEEPDPLYTLIGALADLVGSTRHLLADDDRLLAGPLSAEDLRALVLAEAQTLRELHAVLSTVPDLLERLAAQRDHARALVEWEYYGRPYDEPDIDPDHDDGWDYRVEEIERMPTPVPLAAMLEH